MLSMLSIVDFGLAFYLSKRILKVLKILRRFWVSVGALLSGPKLCMGNFNSEF